ncbi:hypothetical protein G3I71_47905 [Streptomyces sp. SID12501]|uniref:Uncharacterized protein n=1 Tax=Streptomyces sp. SID12501 TaxID=2706042 RepID=A0A6B3C938_9ACTN|nr:hypothetical protein [Streptomyces sp. SID12501]
MRGVAVMGGMQDKRQEPGKGREEQQQERTSRPGRERTDRPEQDPVHPGTSAVKARGKSPEELKYPRQDENPRERDEDERRDGES